ncbi:MAG TPA: hypothetical protein VNO21_15145 [Polyangiaceae bacterium]|nr:hypothetical protein [Polyangiaceae bacterium]
MAKESADLSLLEEVVAPAILDAMRVASAALTRLGVRHALVGGLAVGAHGHPRATKDVDFLVGEEAFEHHEGGLVTMKYGMPIQVRGVLVDFLSIGEGEEHLAAGLALASDDVPVISAPALVYLKLKSPRSKDRVDLIEMVKAGLETAAVNVYLTTNAPGVLPKWESVVADARAEED